MEKIGNLPTFVPEKIKKSSEPNNDCLKGETTLTELRQLDLEKMTPLEALNLLNRWKKSLTEVT